MARFKKESAFKNQNISRHRHDRDVLSGFFFFLKILFSLSPKIEKREIFYPVLSGYD